MKIKLIEIINCNMVLNELANSKSTNIKAVYKIAKINRELKKELELIEEKRVEILKKYCEKDENDEPIIENQQYKILPQYTKELQNELNDFLLIESEINIEPLRLEDLEGFDLSSRQISELLTIMEE